MYTLNDYCRKTFGEKLYKISLNGGFTCPNRDGTLDTRGCIFCSAGGSGDFAEAPRASVWEQIEAGKAQVQKKMGKGGRYIAYFQAYTNTYGPLERLERLFFQAVSHPEVAVLSIATRPDCLPEEVLALLERLNRQKPVWVELGLQTLHEHTAAHIRRGYPLPVYERALRELKARGISVITHVILGLPGESREDMLETVHYLACGIPVEPPALPSVLQEEAVVPPSSLQEKAVIPSPTLQEKSVVPPSSLQEKAVVPSPTLHGAPTVLPSTLQDEAADQASHTFAPVIRTDGIKLQLLHILKGTDLAAEYKKGQISVLSLEEYLPLLADCIRLLPPDMVVHRITGDGPKQLLLAPLWTGNKKQVLNAISRYFRENQVVQGSLYP